VELKSEGVCTCVRACVTGWRHSPTGLPPTFSLRAFSARKLITFALSLGFTVSVYKTSGTKNEYGTKVRRYNDTVPVPWAGHFR